MSLQREDGILIVEGRGDEFTREWRVAPVEDRVILKDRRPAVRQHTELGTLYFTLTPGAWDRLRRLPRNRLIYGNRSKLCELCGTELKMCVEYEVVWCFRCPSCGSVEMHGKDRVGGTRGAGEKEKLPSGKREL